ncbi:hypothetical protein DBV15_11173 [Temnothorax longispinosus]|uniref:Uncharacterized protein n=1 Tax=Temnothorax longispinosus TaxID=300112 RepID=A0A4S2KRG9_9HYME|nr:hypothetical protein DBV15_11173 [Temnothorax longispinosus]
MWCFQQPTERSCHHSDYSTCGHRRRDSGSAGHLGKRHSLKPASSAAAAGEGWRTPMDPEGSSPSSASASGYRELRNAYRRSLAFNFSIRRAFPDPTEQTD